MRLFELTFPRGLCLLCSALLLGCAHEEERPCAAVGARDLVIYEGSKFAAERIVPGRRQSCTSAAPLGPVFADALSRIPVKLRPSLTVHVGAQAVPGGPTFGFVEYHRASRSLLVQADAASGLTPSVALHEIAHVVLDGARPNERVARRLHHAVSEAVADYWAAQFAGSPRLGSAQLGEVRDLSKAPTLGRSEWARLALPQPLPVHRFAHSLAGILWREAPRDVKYLTDLVAMLATRDRFNQRADTPRELLRALGSRCPKRSRARLLQALRAWLPPELVESS